MVPADQTWFQRAVFYEVLARAFGQMLLQSISNEARQQMVGPNNSQVTDTTEGTPAFAVWVTQVNVMYSLLQDIRDNGAWTVQPDVSTCAGDPAVNGTMFFWY